MNPGIYSLTATLLFTILACRPEQRLPAYLEEVQATSVVASSQRISVTTEEIILREAQTGGKINPIQVSIKPEVISFKDDIKVEPVNANVVPAVVSKVVPIPKELPVVIPGKAGIPLPDTVVGRFEVVSIEEIPPVPTSPPSFKDWATSSIQYLGREHGFELESVTTMLEDSRGHLWFGCVFQNAIQGVSRYDGVSFTHFSIGRVGSILEDSRGRLWFGTTSGLMLYDGHSFKIFKGEQAPIGARSIQEDSQKQLWFGTPNGLYHFDPEAHDGRSLSAKGAVFTHYTTEQGLSSNWINAIVEDKTGNLWLGTDKGLDHYDRSQGSFIQYPTKKGLGGNEVFSILEDKQSNLWFGSRKGLYRYVPPPPAGVEDSEDSLSVKEAGFIYYTTPQIPSDYMVFDMLEDSLGNIWVGTGFGLIRFEPDEARIGGQFTHFTVREGLSGEIVWSLLLDSNSDIWAGFLGGGVSRYLSAGFNFYTDREGLTANTIRSQLEDRQGNIWWGTMRGLARYDPASSDSGLAHLVQYLKIGAKIPLFAVRSIVEDSRGDIWFENDHSLFHYDPANEWVLSTYPGLGNSRVNLKLEDSRKNVWFGTGNGLGRYVPDEGSGPGKFTQFILDGVNVRRADLVEDRWGKIWIGIDNNLIRYDAEPDRGKGHFTRYTAGEMLGGNRILSMQKDSQGNIWMVTDKGLTHFKPDRNGERADLIHYTTWESLARVPYQIMREDEQGNFWILTNTGLSRFSPKVNGAEYTHFPAEKGFKDLRFEGSLEDSQGNLWLISMTNGLWHYDQARDRFTHYTTQHGLKANRIQAVVEDPKHNIWVITFDGINLFVPQTDEQMSSEADPYQIFAFDISNGIRLIMGMHTHAFIDRSDQLWWTTNQGLGKLDLQQFQLPKITVPRISLNTITINQTFIDYRSLPDTAYQLMLAFGEDLSGTFDSVAAFYNYPHHLSLPHHLNHLTFHFSAIDWASPQMLKYRFVLEGWDNKWNPASSNTAAEYRNLRPGKYTFKVQAVGMAQIWSDIFEYQFRVLPPWWLSWWAYLLYGLMLAFLLYSIYKFLLARRLERSETERIMELDALKIRLYANITHEFRTPLTIILGMARQIRDDPKKWYNEGLQMITRNGRQLLNLVNQMLDLSKLDKGKLKLKLQRGEIIRFIHYLVQSFESFAAAKNIHLHFLKEIDQLEMDFDPDQLSKVVGNLLSNAVKYTPEDGQVYVILRHQQVDPDETSGVLEIRFKDTGTGISPADLPHIFDRFYQADNSTTRKGEGTGIGLALAKELVTLMGGNMQVQSKLGAGSDFVVVLPVTRSVAKVEPGLTQVEIPHRNAIPPMPLADYSAGPLNLASENGLRGVNTEKELPLALLIEDNHDVLTYLASCLEGKYQLEFAMNGQEAIEQALEIVPDIIISDVMMPEKDGYEVCTTLKANIRTSHVPIILLTAKADQDSRITGLRSGADAYLAKPFDKEELDVRLEKLLESRRQLQARYRRPGSSVTMEEQSLNKEEQFLKELSEMVKENLSDENFGIIQLCRKIGMSRSQLHNKLKALTGHSTSIYIRTIRLERAKELLRTADLNISEVAYEVGFRTPLYFTQVFSDEVGMAPSTYRAENEK